MDSKVDKTTQEQKDASQDDRLTALERYAITTPGEAGQVWTSDGSGAGKWGAKITLSTSSPSGGSNGDLWFVYE